MPLNPFHTTARDALRVIRGVRLPALVSLTAGYAIGALTNVYPWQAFILFCGIAAVLASFAIFNFVWSRQIKGLTPWELSLRDPDNNAAAAAARANEDHLVVGQAIEVISHPEINSRFELSKLGWRPEDVEIRDLQLCFDATSIVENSGGLKSFDPPNGKKYSLVETSFVTSDSPHLALSTKSTDYFTIKSILPTLRCNPAIRAEFGDLNPTLNRIPHSLCLHYLVRFANGDVLCMKRDSRAVYHGDRWSFSGEEQVSELDFESDTPCLTLFQRTFCEEVLPLRENRPLVERWREASPIIERMALWSVFLEEEIHNFSLLGFYQVNCDPEEFCAYHKDLVAKGVGTKDTEGKYYIARESDLIGLLVAGNCMVSPLFAATEKVEVLAQNLHPTSRYRVFRFLRALNRGPLNADGYVLPAT